MQHVELVGFISFFQHTNAYNKFRDTVRGRSRLQVRYNALQACRRHGAAEFAARLLFWKFRI